MVQKIGQLCLFGLVLVSMLLVVSGSGLAISDPSALKLTLLNAKAGEDVVGEFGITLEIGIVVEIEVTASVETKVWPSDFAVSYVVDDVERRVTGYAITNAVSDPEDERIWRFTQPVTIRKGTRYFSVYFTSLFSLDPTTALDIDLVEDIQILHRSLVPGTLTVEKPVVEDDEYGLGIDDYEYKYGIGMP